MSLFTSSGSFSLSLDRSQDDHANINLLFSADLRGDHAVNPQRKGS